MNFFESENSEFDIWLSPYVFISYRRNDSEHFVPRLYEHLLKDFAEDKVFYDKQSIESGDRFGEVIEEKANNCKVFILVIGTKWFSENNRNRLRDPEDWVRREIIIAIKNNVHIIPLLIDNASMPVYELLPDELKKFTENNAHHINEICFEDRVNALRKRIQKTIPIQERLLNAYHEGEITSDQFNRIPRLPVPIQEIEFDKAIQEAPIREKLLSDLKSKRLQEARQALKDLLDSDDSGSVRFACVTAKKVDGFIELLIDCHLLIPRNSYQDAIFSKGWQMNNEGRYAKRYAIDVNDKYLTIEGRLPQIADEIIEINQAAGVEAFGVYVAYPID